MFKRFRNTPDNQPAHSQELLRKGRSPFSAKSVWFAGGLFLGAAGTMLAGPAEGAIDSWIKGLAPKVMALAGSYLAGFFIG